MSESAAERSGLEIISELLSLTRLMVAKIDNSDFLVSSVDERGRLLEEYGYLKNSSASAKAEIEKDKPKIDKMISEITNFDKQINAALIAFRDEAKRDLQNSNTQKKVLNYTNNTISSSGSYLDIKK